MDILHEIVSALASEDRVMLATIISTSGSTPAPVLSKMLVKNGGRTSVGTIGGGCMEGDVLAETNRMSPSGGAAVMTFHLDEDDAESGLICGGSADVLIEPLSTGDIPLFVQLKRLRDEGRDSVLLRRIAADGAVSGKCLFDASSDPPAGVSTGEGAEGGDFLGALGGPIREAARRQEMRRIPHGDGEVILEPVPGRPHLVIFGGGHVARYVSSAAAVAGFRITVVDDREKYSNRERFPEADRTLAADFTGAFSMLDITPSTFIVIVTRGHRHDEEVLELAVKTPARYIGMIGSRRKVLTTYGHLQERGVSAESLRRVRAPVGIDIGAVSAEEIGISIVAELIAERRAPGKALAHKSDTMEGFFNDR